MQPISSSRELSAAMTDINSLLNLNQQQHHHQISPSSSSLDQGIHHQHLHQGQSQMFDPSHDEFLEQMLSSVPSAAASANSFPWADEHEQLEEHSLASKLRQQQISNGSAAKALLLHQQQMLLSRSLNGLRSPAADSSAAGFIPMPIQGDHNVVVDGSSPFKPNTTANPANGAATVKALLNGFTAGSLGQTSPNPQSQQHFHHAQAQTFGATAAPPSPAPAVSGSSGGGAAAGQPRQRVRARRGQATDPHSIAERLRRERIAERMKSLQELVPNANKTDKASMLDEIIDYVKFLQLQVKVLSMSRLGGAAAVAPLVADISSSEGRTGNGTQAASTSNNDGMAVTEQQVAKLMEEDMGSAMQYLQGKGLCLMPISLATAISTATSPHSRKPLTLPPSNNNNPLLINGDGGGPTSPSSMSALTVQSTGGELNASKQ